MANIITNSDKHDKFGKTRSEHEENMRKEWGHTMSDGQLDKLKFIEKKTEDANGSKKNFATGIEIDRLDPVGAAIKKTARIIVMGYSKQGRINYDRIFGTGEM